MDLFEKIVSMFREQARAGIFPAHLEHADLSRATTLGDLGIDSLGKMALLTALMDLADQYFPDDAFKDDHTLEEIAQIAGAAPSSIAALN
jgi:acyl carrier protein